MNWFSAQEAPAVTPPPAEASWFGSLTGGNSNADVGAGSSSLSYRQRLTMFFVLIALAVLFFFLASLSIIMPVKFAKLFFLGSFFLISSLAFLVGPWALLTSAFSKERLLTTLAYLGSAALTLLCSVTLESTLLTMGALALQCLCSLWLALSFLPFSASFLGYGARSLLPI